MGDFKQPWFLLLFLLVPPLVWWWLHRPRTALRFPATGGLARLPVGRSRVVHWSGVGFRAAVLALLIIALAGPRWPIEGERLPTEGIAIVMLVDVSGSMAEQDFDWQSERISRLEAVKRAFRLFVQGGDGPDGIHMDGRPNDLIGLVAFASFPESVCPLTLSRSAVIQMLEAEKPRTVPGRSETNISDAIAWGLTRLESAGRRRKVMILLSDGEHNVPHPQSGWTPRQAAQIAANLHVPVYTIDAAGEGGTSMEPDAGADSAANRAAGIRTLQEIAQISQGHYFQAHDTQALLDVCRKIDALERDPITSFQYRRYHEGYPWFGLASFVVLVTALTLEMTVWRRLP